MADYCVARMKPYVDSKTGHPISGALDYVEFTRTLFQSWKDIKMQHYFVLV